MSSSLEVPYSLRALWSRSLVGLSLLATHGRPSIMMTLSGPSCATIQVPTIGSNVAGGLPTVSFDRSTLRSSARTRDIAAATPIDRTTKRDCMDINSGMYREREAYY